MIRFARKLALPVCFALIAGVACGGDDEGNEGATGSDSKSDIKIGAIFDLSGATADIGTPYAEGIRDYIEYRNASPEKGVDGHKLVLSWQDFKYDPTLAGQLYGQYVSEGAKVFLGWGTADTEAPSASVQATAAAVDRAAAVAPPAPGLRGGGAALLRGS